MNKLIMNSLKILLIPIAIFSVLGFVMINKPTHSRTANNKIQQETRIALVIGNNNYEHISSLANPVNDGKVMKRALQNVGFEVIELYDANRQEMIDEIQSIRSKLIGKKANFLLFYAGHGIQYNEDNWLIPVDAHPQIPEDVKVSCVSLNFILNNLKFVKTKMNIIILDACRVNPFKYAGRSTTGGLIAPSESPNGTFLAFSTAPRKVALDGTGRNSPYTEILSKAIQIPNIPIEKTFKIVRNSLMEATGQVSWENSSLLGDFYFKRDAQVVVDSDGDGVNDDLDQCPNLAGAIQNKGCPKTAVTSKKMAIPTGMVYIKGGLFDMGDVFDEGDNDEKPVKEVLVNEFFMDKYEVSNGEFCEFLNDEGNQKEDDEYWLEINSQYCGIVESNGKFTPKSGFDNLPVVEVNWYGAKAYCKWRTAKQQGSYRLPTEAEWEFAARSRGKKIRFGNGKDVAKSKEMNFNSSMKEHNKYYKLSKHVGKITPVTSFGPNELGLYNMAGNVWEWCSDIYSSESKESKEASRDFVMTSNKKRIIKGGAWDGPASYARASNKFSVPPRVGYFNIGFRCIKEAN